MGWRDMRKRSVTGSVPDWQAWAGQKRWEYREPASDLAGRFYPPPSGPGSATTATPRHPEVQQYQVALPLTVLPVTGRATTIGAGGSGAAVATVPKDTVGATFPGVGTTGN